MGSSRLCMLCLYMHLYMLRLCTGFHTLFSFLLHSGALICIHFAVDLATRVHICTCISLETLIHCARCVHALCPCHQFQCRHLLLLAITCNSPTQPQPLLLWGLQPFSPVFTVLHCQGSHLYSVPNEWHLCMWFTMSEHIQR
jgi:hypothetical protein